MSQTRVINVRVNTSRAQAQLSGLNRQLSNTGTQSTRASQGAQGLSDTLGRAQMVAAAALATTAIFKLSEAYAQFNAKIDLATDGAEEFNAVQKSIIATSLETGTSMTANANVFQRLANALGSSGVNSIQVTETLNTLNKAFAVSGVSGAEASATLTQLSQAFASGVLRGDEFNSIAEQAPILLDAISKSSGIAKSKLRELASEGKLTSEVVFKGITDSAGDVNAQFEQLPITISRVTANFATVATGGIGVLDDKLGELLDTLSKFDAKEGESFSEKLLFAANAAIISVGEVLGLVEKSEAQLFSERDIYYGILFESEEKLADLKARGFADSEKAVNKEREAIKFANEKIIALSAEIAARGENKKLAIEQGQASADEAQAQEKILLKANEISDLYRVLLEIQKDIVAEENTLGDSVLDKINKKYNDRIDSLSAAKKLLNDGGELNLKQLDQLVQIEDQLDILEGKREAELENRRAVLKLEQDIIDAKNAEKIVELTDEAVGSGKELTKGIDDLPEPFEAEENEFDKLKEKNDVLLELNKEFFNAELALLQEQRNQELLTESEFQDEKTRLLADSEMERKNIQEAVLKAKEAITLGSFSSALKAASTFSKKALKISQAVGIAETVVSIARGIAKAQELGFPANIAEGARVAAVGIAQIKSIKSASSGSTPSASSSGGGGGGSAPQFRAPSSDIASPTRDITTSRSSEQGEILNELRRVDSEFLPTPLVRNIAARLAEIQEESGLPTGGFDQ